MKPIRKRLTYANVMSSIAVFMVLGGGAAIAATTILPKNSVGTKQLRKNAVKTAKIGKEAVKGGKLANGAVVTDKLANGAVTTDKIADDAVTGAKVNESTLATVPDASKLAGQPPSDFVAKTELLWALVDGDTGSASIVRSRGATSASSPGTGRYLVTFDRDITGCGLVATLGDATAATGSPGEISLDQPIESSVEVNTYDSAGAPADTLATNGFYIQVTC